MKLKRVLSICMILIIGISAVACGKKADVELPPEPEPAEQGAFPDDNKAEWIVVENDTAVFEGYRELPFAEFLKKGITATYQSQNQVKKCEVICHQGWNAEGLLDEGALAEGNKALTYDVEILVNFDGTDSVVGFKFYMEQTPDNVLRAAAAEKHQAGTEYGEVWNDAEATELLKQLTEYMKG